MKDDVFVMRWKVMCLWWDERWVCDKMKDDVIVYDEMTADVFFCDEMKDDVFVMKWKMIIMMVCDEMKYDFVYDAIKYVFMMRRNMMCLWWDESWFVCDEMKDDVVVIERMKMYVVIVIRWNIGGIVITWRWCKCLWSGKHSVADILHDNDSTSNHLSAGVQCFGVSSWAHNDSHWHSSLFSDGCLEEQTKVC